MYTHTSINTIILHHCKLYQDNDFVKTITILLTKTVIQVKETMSEHT